MSEDPHVAAGSTLLAVSGMTCSTCVRIVTNALSRVPGAGAVEVDLDTGRAVIVRTARPEALVAAVEKAG
jgi:copper chaperone CopZ